MRPGPLLLGLTLAFGAALTAEVAIWAALNSKAWWAVAAPAVGGYAVLILGVILKDKDNPVSRLIKLVIDAVLARLWLNVLVLVLAAGAAMGLGLWLLKVGIPPDGEYRVVAFEEANIPGHRVRDLPIVFEVQAPKKHKGVTELKTDVDGLAAFPAHLGDLLTVRVRHKEKGLYVVEAGRGLNEEDLQSVKLFDLDKVPAEEWVRPTAQAPLGPIVRLLEDRVPDLRWSGGAASTFYGARSGAQPFALLGALPGAEAIVVHSAYVAGFDPRRRLPRWILYEVHPRAPGIRRADTFARDPLLPPDVQAETTDYRGSGYDRGHLARFSDVAVSAQAVQEAYYLTAIAPQTPALNRGAWLALEEHTSRLRKQDGSNRVFVIRGPAFLEHTGPGGDRVIAIGANRIPVPTHFFQVAAVFENGNLRLECFLMPNTKAYGARRFSPDLNLDPFRTTQARIEELTGLRLFVTAAAPIQGCRAA